MPQGIYVLTIAVMVLTMLGIVLAVALLNRLGLIDKEREYWAKERQKLLDRIMAVDYNKYLLGQEEFAAKPGTEEKAEQYNKWEDLSIIGSIQERMPEKKENF